MVPDENDIRLASYFRWQRTGSRLGFDQEDWFESESDLSIKLNYHILFASKLDVGEKVYVGNPDRRMCRYCRKTSLETTFRKEAHALPELIGNRILIALDECDRCNEFFSRALEDHFSKFTLPFRAGLAINGKKGVPSFKSSDKKARMDFHADERRFSIMDLEESRVLFHDEESKSIRLSLPTQPYIPVAVFKCLTKMALAIMPPEELRFFGRAIDWILNPDHSADLTPHGNLGCYLYFSPQPFPEVWTSLLRRTEPGSPLPYMLFMIGSANMLMQIFVPFCDRDVHLLGRSIAVPRFDLSSVPGLERCSCEVVPLSSHEVTRSTRLTLTSSYESHEPVEEQDWPF